MPPSAHRRRRVVFERRTQRQSSASHATTPPHRNQPERFSSSLLGEQPPEQAKVDHSSKPFSLPVDSARTGPPLRVGPGDTIDLPPPSDLDSAPVGDPAAAAYLFPTPPPVPSSAPMSYGSGATAATAAEETFNIPDYFLRDPILKGEDTESWELQKETIDECMPFLAGQASDELGSYNSAGLPVLKKEDHVDFLKDSLEQRPGAWTAADSSRPWTVYWAFAGLSTLGEDVSEYEDRAIGNFTAAQNADGGIGGSHGQLSHIAATYAAVLSLTVLGERALAIIDRKSMWQWLGRMKQADGGFSVCEGAEVDVRGAYCAMVLISILNLPLDLPPDAPARRAGLTSFTDELPQWLSRCQTYEGGVSAYPGTEAHGGYAFCAVACACILGEPKDVIPKIFNLPLLISWLSARQYAPEGGFSGRTNKLVDGCYSHWVGGCWPLINAALVESNTLQQSSSASEDLYSREGLIRYILCCCQQPDGGLRDKPSKTPDAYHSCYVLAGLSSAQHNVIFTSAQDVVETHGHAFRWSLDPERPVWEGVERLELEIDSIVNPVHPVFVIPFEAVERARAWGLQKTGF